MTDNEMTVRPGHRLVALFYPMWNGQPANYVGETVKIRLRTYAGGPLILEKDLVAQTPSGWVLDASGTETTPIAKSGIWEVVHFNPSTPNDAQTALSGRYVVRRGAY
ncbi:MAG TPA: hypothetical protein VM715_04630 [Candidatus Acidoferrum sp.]|jgi:hypothetical protein|nr:hypothetical protein [Candidatus Acidoferrum sp.]